MATGWVLMPELVEVRDAFFEMEMREGFFQLEFRGVRFWDYIRAFVFQDVAAGCGCTHAWHQVRASQAARANAFSRELPLLVVEGLRQRVARGKPVEMIFFDSDIRRVIDGKTVDFRGYPFIKAAATAVKTLAVSPAPLTSSVADLYPCEVVSSRPAHFLGKVRRLSSRIPPAGTTAIAEIEEKVASVFGVTLSVRKQFKGVFLSQFFERDWLERLFQMRRPQLVGFLMDYRKKAVVEMAHLAGALVFELQHGATGEFDLGESYPRDVCSQGIPTLADAILTFGPYWAKKFNVPGATKLAVGFPYFEEMTRDFVKEKPVGPFQAVLCPSTADLGFAQVLAEVAQRLPAVRFYFKLRAPEYGRCQEIYGPVLPNLSNVTVVESDSISIYDLMQTCDALLSTASTAIYEAMALGCTPIIYTGIFYEDVLDLVRDGYAVLASSAGEIAQFLQGGIALRRADSKQFFLPGSAKAIPSRLLELLAMKPPEHMTNDEEKR